MSQAKNSTQVLKAALWMLENVGWVQDTYSTTDETGKITGMCASEAIALVDTDAGSRSRAYDRLIAVLPASGIVHFNDHKKTTKKKVINAFKRALNKGTK